MIDANRNSYVNRKRLREFTINDAVVSTCNAFHAIACKMMAVARRVFRTFLMESMTIPV